MLVMEVPTRYYSHIELSIAKIGSSTESSPFELAEVTHTCILSQCERYLQLAFPAPHLEARQHSFLNCYIEPADHGQPIPYLLLALP